MNGPEPEWMLVSWVRLVQARWVATGVPRQVRAELLRQLLSDLAAARAAGARIEELIATPPAVFADSCAAGLPPRSTPISTTSLLKVCLGTGLVASGGAWLLLLLVSRLDLTTTLGLDEGDFYLFLDLFVVAAVLTVMVAITRWTYRRHHDIEALTPRLAVTLVGGTLIGFPLASIYGAGSGYSNSSDVVMPEVLIVLTFLTLAIIAAQRWTRSRRKPVPPPTSALI